MKNNTWYSCSNPKGCWSEGEYFIGHGNHYQNSITIWVNNQAGVTGLKTVKSAIEILKQEFENVLKIKR